MLSASLLYEALLHVAELRVSIQLLLDLLVSLIKLYPDKSSHSFLSWSFIPHGFAKSMVYKTSLASWNCGLLYSSTVAPNRRFNDFKFSLVSLGLVARSAPICVWLQKANILGLLSVVSGYRFCSDKFPTSKIFTGFTSSLLLRYWLSAVPMYDAVSRLVLVLLWASLKQWEQVNTVFLRIGFFARDMSIPDCATQNVPVLGKYTGNSEMSLLETSI